MDDTQAMQLAIEESLLALEHDDVPVGAVVLVDGQIIAKRHNERQLTGDPTAHAEVLALRDAAALRGDWRLQDITLVVTLEPCAMCAGAAINARVGRVVFGAYDPKAGAAATLYNLLVDPRLNHQCEVSGGVLAEKCGKIMTDFFSERR